MLQERRGWRPLNRNTDMREQSTCRRRALQERRGLGVPEQEHCHAIGGGS